jgi:hypothetical protein
VDVVTQVAGHLLNHDRSVRFAAERKEGLTDALAQGRFDPDGLFPEGNVVGDVVLVLHGKNSIGPTGLSHR